MGIARLLFAPLVSEYVRLYVPFVQYVHLSVPRYLSLHVFGYRYEYVSGYRYEYVSGYRYEYLNGPIAIRTFRCEHQNL